MWNWKHLYLCQTSITWMVTLEMPRVMDNSQNRLKKTHTQLTYFLSNILYVQQFKNIPLLKGDEIGNNSSFYGKVFKFPGHVHMIMNHQTLIFQLKPSHFYHMCIWKNIWFINECEASDVWNLCCSKTCWAYHSTKVKGNKYLQSQHFCLELIKQDVDLTVLR